MGEIRGNPGILGQGGYLVHKGGIHPRMLPGWTRGVSSSPHPRMLPGWERYVGIPGYLDKGGI